MSAVAPAPPPHRSAAAPAPGASSGAPANATNTPAEASTALPELPHLRGSGTPTPRLLVILLSLTTVITLLFGAGAAAAMLHTRSELTQASRHTEQAARIQEIHSQVLRADAAAAQSLLAGPANSSQIDVHQASLRSARELLVVAAAAHASDSEQLARVNAELNTYAAALERARLTPVGATAGRDELDQAQRQLRDTVLPELNGLIESHSDRVNQAVAPVPTAMVASLGVLAAVTLVMTAVATAVRFHRVVNPGLLVGVALVFATVGMTTSLLNQANAAGAGAVRSDMATLTAAATARAAGYDARVQDAMIVLTRGDPGAVQRWDQADQAARAAVEGVDPSTERSRLQAGWDRYAGAHDELVGAGSAGQWDRARDQALGTSPDAAGGAFAGFEQAAIEIATEARDTALTRFEASLDGLAMAAIGGLLATAGAIAAAITGVRGRLREYR